MVIDSTASRAARVNRVSTGERITAFALALLCLALLITAASIVPDAHGHGTHTQLGLPPCGWAMVMGKPCPTCGMTTSFAYAVRGNVAASLAAQPFGTLLAIFTSCLFWIALHTALTGSTLVRLTLSLLRPRILWTLAALGAMAWAYKWVTWPAI
jgi:hypothetical protein